MRQFYICNKGFHETAAPEKGCWVNVECPDNSDFHFLTDEVKIPEIVLDYAADIDERPRIERDGKWMLTILRIPAHSGNPDNPIYTVPLAIISDDDKVITVCYHKTEMIKDFVAHSCIRKIDVNNRADFILRIIYSSAYWYLEYLKQMAEQVMSAEKHLDKSVKNSDLQEMLRLEKGLVYFNTSLKGNEGLIGRLRHVFPDTIDTDLLEDVEIEFEQALNTATIYSEILENTVSTFASVISNNVNLVMKRMTSLSLVLMIPTLIASFYGMNVTIGLSSVPYAFWIILGGSFILTLITFLWLKYIKWF